MAIINIETIQLKAASKSEADKNESVLADREPLLVKQLDGSFTLLVGDGSTEIKDLPRPASSGVVPGDILLDTQLKTLSEVQNAKVGSYYYQLLDDGKDSSGNELYGYQWLTCENYPNLYKDLYDGIILNSVQTPSISPQVYDDETACSIAGGVDYTIINEETTGTSEKVYQLEATNSTTSSFSKYYEDYIWDGSALITDGLKSRAYKGMVVYTTNSHLTDISSMATVFGGTWVQTATSSESTINQFICTAHTNTGDSEWDNKLGSYLGMKITMYLPSISSSSDALNQAENIYGGSWNSISTGTESTDHIFQMFKSAN